MIVNSKIRCFIWLFHICSILWTSREFNLPNCIGIGPRIENTRLVLPLESVWPDSDVLWLDDISIVSYIWLRKCVHDFFSAVFIFYERLNDSNSFLQWVTKSPIHLLWNHKLGQLQQLAVPFMPTKTTRKCIHYINIARAAVLFCCLPFIDHTIFLYATYTLLNNNTSILYVMRHNIKNNAYNGKQCKIKTLEKFEKVT